MHTRSILTSYAAYSFMLGNPFTASCAHFSQNSLVLQNRLNFRVSKAQSFMGMAMIIW